MVTAQDCLKKYGPAHLEKTMVLWDVPPGTRNRGDPETHLL